ncbi:hypothetical protein [uncultured Tateyamaria sp.]|uniref:MoaF-related domain-containing protein n=1 Tax=uncultured Tateyamaria sp. TaxID=455651 RepID=UPI00262F6D9F|nr:hypothetical protein [uncultured Tateyamaria sp.]
MKTILALILAVSLSVPAIAQEKTSLDRDEYLLDGINFTFQNQNADAADISFADGEVTYAWIAGRQAGNPSVTVPYKSQKLDTDIYLVGWNEPQSKTFVTMVYNFKSNTSSVSVLARYGNDEPFFGFQGGVIEHVTMN